MSTINKLSIQYNRQCEIYNIYPDIIIENKETEIIISLLGNICYDFYQQQQEQIICNFDDNFIEYTSSSMIYDSILNITNISCITPLFRSFFVSC